MTFNITIKQSDSEKRPASTVVLQGVHYFCVSSLPNTFFKVCFVKKYISIKRSHLFSRDSSLLRLLSQERLNVEIDHHPTNKISPCLLLFFVIVFCLYLNSRPCASLFTVSWFFRERSRMRERALQSSGRY